MSGLRSVENGNLVMPLNVDGLPVIAAGSNDTEVVRTVSLDNFNPRLNEDGLPVVAMAGSGGGGDGTFDHRQLTSTSRNASNQHPATSIQMSDGSTVQDSVVTLENEVSKLESVFSDTYSEIKSLADQGKLIPGNLYEINDYETIYIQPVSLEVRSDSSNLFNIILRAVTPYRFAPEGWVSQTNRTQPAGSVITASTPIDRWQILYDINNDTNRYDWATPTGKGVIYWLENHLGNAASCDFYNTKYIRYKVTATTTFATSIVNQYVASQKTLENCTVSATDFVSSLMFDFAKSVTNNRMFARVTASKLSLPNNIFKGDCANNSFSNTIFENTFLSNCTNNTFGPSTYRNIVIGTCNRMTIQNQVFGNIFGGRAVQGNIIAAFSNNIFGGNVDSCSFYGTCEQNKFKGVVANSTFGGYFYNNTFNGTVETVEAVVGINNCTFSGNLNDTSFTGVQSSKNFTGKDIYDKVRSQTINQNGGGVTEIRWYDASGVMQRITI